MSSEMSKFGNESPSEAAQNNKVAQACVALLAKEDILPKVEVPWQAASALLERCRAGVHISESAITTRMGRLLFGVAFGHQPARVLVVGSYQAAAIMWIASGVGRHATCIGVDIDESANEVARANLSVLSLANVTIRHVDGHRAGELFDGKIDLVLLDAEKQLNGQTSKAIYTTLLSSLEPYLADGALILAHDATLPKFAADFEQLKDYFRQSGRFDRCATLPIDRYGLLIARRSQHD